MLGKLPKPLLRALLVGLLLRVLWTIAVPATLTSDTFVYHTGAAQIAAGNGFAYEDGSPNAFWPAGYSAAVGAAYFLLGTHTSVAHALNILLGLWLIWQMYVLGRRTGGERAGSLCAWMTALYPSFIMYSTVIASENLYLPLLVSFANLSLLLIEDADATHAVTLRRVLLGGVLFGVATLVRPTALALPVALALAGLFYRASLRRLFAITLGTVVLGLLLCVPWGLRNQRHFGKFTISSFNGGVVLWFGNHEGEPGQELPERFERLNVADCNSAMGAEAVAFIKANPGTYLRLSVNRIRVALQSEAIAVAWNGDGVAARFGEKGPLVLRWIATLAWAALVAMTLWALWGAIRARDFQPSDMLLFLLVGASSAPFILIDSQDRYHLPLVPFLMAYVARRLGQAGAAADA